MNLCKAVPSLSQENAPPLWKEKFLPFFLGMKYNETT